VNIAWVHHKVQPVDFPVALFPCRLSVEKYAGDRSLGWAPFLRAGFEQSMVGGDHRTVLSPPFVVDNVAIIEQSLTRAELHPPARLTEPVPH
jgi:hypothetical protein